MAFKSSILRNYDANQIVFRENTLGKRAYIIKEGAVDFSIIRGGNKIIIGNLKKGSCFGEMALITNMPRTATATTTEPTSLYELDEVMFNDELSKAGILAQGIIRTLMNTIKKLNEQIAINPLYVNPKQAIAKILSSYAKLSTTNDGASSATLSYDDMLNEISEIIGLRNFHLDNELEEMKSLGLLKIDRKNEGEWSIVVNPETIVDQTKTACQQLEKNSNDNYNVAEVDYIDIKEAAKLYNLRVENIYQMIGDKKIPENVFLFIKTSMSNFMDSKNNVFLDFQENKKISELESFDDLIFVDRKAISEVFSKINYSQIAQILFYLKDNEYIKGLILNCFTNKTQLAISSIMENIEDVDEFDIFSLETAVIQQIKNLES